MHGFCTYVGCRNSRFVVPGMYCVDFPNITFITTCKILHRYIKSSFRKTLEKYANKYHFLHAIHTVVVKWIIVAPVAQGIEHFSPKEGVVCSNHIRGTLPTLAYGNT